MEVVDQHLPSGLSSQTVQTAHEVASTWPAHLPEARGPPGKQTPGSAEHRRVPQTAWTHGDAWSHTGFAVRAGLHLKQDILHGIFRRYLDAKLLPCRRILGPSKQFRGVLHTCRDIAATFRPASALDLADGLTLMQDPHPIEKDCYMAATDSTAHRAMRRRLVATSTMLRPVFAVLK